MTYTCIIIDDEPHAIQQLTEYIREIPVLKLKKAYTCSTLALTEIMEMKGSIDIVFTDVEMPALSGLELSKRIQDRVRHLIFVTGHTEYALDGYGLNVKEFLLKPFNFKKFEDIMQSTIKRLTIEDPFITLKVKEDKSLLKIKLEDIVFIEAEGNYIKIHTEKKSLLMISNLSDIEEKLRYYKYFIKIHKSYVVSLKHVEKFKNDFICLKNGKKLSVSHTYKNEIATYFLLK